jgi:hypothetical protein
LPRARCAIAQDHADDGQADDVLSSDSQKSKASACNEAKPAPRATAISIRNIYGIDRQDNPQHALIGGIASWRIRVMGATGS